jgi:hypothetical protein
MQQLVADHGYSSWQQITECGSWQRLTDVAATDSQHKKEHR